MPVDEEARHEVYEDLKRVHGARVSGLILEMLPPAGVPELATKDDVAALGRELRGEIRGLGAELRAEIQGVKAEFGERLEREMRRQTTRFVGWMLALVGLVMAASSAAAGLVARGGI